MSTPAASPAVETTLAQTLARFAVDVRAASAGLPRELTESVHKRVLDILGIAVAASDLPTSRAAREYVLESRGTPQASAVGIPEKLPAAQAAFVNGVLAHSLDYDDTHLPSVLHPSASVVPAALAAGEAVGASGLAITAAIAVGLEVAVRIGMAGYDRETQNSIFFEHGQHATSICGALGGAVAAALLYDMDEAQITDTIGVAASMAAGLIEANRTGGTVKRMHCGWAAHSAIAATQLVRHGFTGPPTVLEGRFGFFQAWLHGTFFPEEITRDLGVTWSVPGIFFKPYPANHFTHAGIDAARELRAQGLDIDAIESIQLGVPRQNKPTIGEPIETKRSPATGYMAQFSGPYTVVAGLLGGGGLGVGLDDFTDELAQDPRRRALMAKVDVIADEECSAIFPAQFPAVLRIRTHDGTEHVSKVLVNRGGPDNPLSFDELATKFHNNASRFLNEVEMTTLRADVERFDELTDVDSVMGLLRTIAKTQEL